MSRSNIPVYAIVELLMLLAHHNKNIGDYKGHRIRENSVQVKTSRGNITFPTPLIMKQFHDPAAVTHDDLLKALTLFRPLRIGKQTIS
jgi:hypothetical protein